MIVDVIDTQGLQRIRRLPFSFAQRHKLVLEWDEAQHHATVYCVAPLSIPALVEIKRVIKQPFALSEISAEAFEAKITQVYQRDSSEARQLMEDIGADSDDFFLLLKSCHKVKIY
ncbi:hypothetical protein ACT691_10075 [Vibrio metschnikovii]